MDDRELEAIMQQLRARARKRDTSFLYVLSRFIFIVSIIILLGFSIAYVISLKSGLVAGSSTLYRTNPDINYLSSGTGSETPVPSITLPSKYAGTVYPDGFYKTPGNLELVLSGVPVEIEPTSTKEPVTVIQVQLEVDPTEKPKVEPTLVPSPIPSPTFDQAPFIQATATIQAAEVQIQVERKIAAEERRRAILDRLADVGILICSGGMFAVSTILVVFVGYRFYSYYKLEKSLQEKRAIEANPIKAYPPQARDEVTLVWNLINSNIRWCKAQTPPVLPLTEVRIQRYSELDNINTDDWTRATNSLVDRGYAMKSQGRPTYLKYDLSLGHMQQIIIRGWYLDRDAVVKIMELPPSEFRR